MFHCHVWLLKGSIIPELIWTNHQPCQGLVKQPLLRSFSQTYLQYSVDQLHNNRFFGQWKGPNIRPTDVQSIWLNFIIIHKLRSGCLTNPWQGWWLVHRKKRGLYYPSVVKHGEGTFPFIDRCPIKTSISRGFSIAMFDYWRVV